MTDKLHIGVLTGRTPYPNGMAAAQRIHLMARAMVEADACVNVWVDGLDTWKGKFNHEARGAKDGVNFEYLLGKTQASPNKVRRVWDRLALQWASQSRIAVVAQRERLDGLYFYTSILQPDFERVLISLQAKRHHFPVVIDLCEAPWSLKSKPSFIESQVSPLWGAEGVICISRFLEEWVRQENLRNDSKVQSLYVPILVDVNEIKPAGRPPAGKTVLFAGSPGYDETLRFLVEAMQVVWARHADCQLVITGGASRETLMRTGEELDDRILFAGYLERQRLISTYAESTVLAIPLFDDVRSIARFPTKLGEYLASGRPVVTNHVGEIPHFLEDGKNACFAQPGDSKAFGAAIVRLLDQPGWACDVGRAGRLVAERSFHYALFGKALCDFFASTGSILKS